jgi:hypothetical protein
MQARTPVKSNQRLGMIRLARCLFLTLCCAFFTAEGAESAESGRVVASLDFASFSAAASNAVADSDEQPGGPDLIERRGSEPAIRGEVVEVDDSGVTLRSPLGARHVIPWDRIRLVEAPKFAPAVEQRRQIAADLWRARSRIERHDTALAEPLLERLFERYRGQSHQTALVVAEGLLRCRLARGEHALSVVPALEAARIRRAGVTTDSYSMLARVLDEATSLSPLVPPVFGESPHLPRLLHELETYNAQGDAVLTALAMQYRRGVAVAAGVKMGSDPFFTPPDHPGVELMMALLDCRNANQASRRAAIERLSRQLDKLPTWAEPWARFHIGLGMLDEPQREQRQQGLVSLLHLPARFASTQPYLAALALAEAAAALERDGDADAAATLRAQLAQAHPDHARLNSKGSDPFFTPAHPAAPQRH